ncbi:MAG: hypothetical protein ABIC57_01210, partial [bacterium]
SNLDKFSEGLVGSQYIWLIGFRIDDTPQIDLQRPEELTLSIDESVPLDDTEVIVEKDDIPVKLDGKEIKLENPTLGEKFSFIKFVSGIFGKTKEWFKNIDFQLIKRDISSRISALKLRDGPRKKMFVQKNNLLSFDTGDKKRKLIGIGLIVTIIVVIVFSFRAQRNRAYNEEIQKDLDSIESDIGDVEDIWKSDEMQANDLLVRINDSIEELEKKNLSNPQQEKLDELKDSALSVNDQMNRIVAVEDNENYEILIETYLEVGESANVTDININNGYLYLVDNSTHAVYQYDIDGGGTEVVGGSKDTLKEPVLMAIGDKYMFVYDNKLGMLSLDMEAPGADQEFNTMPELSARTIEDVTDIEAFGDNIYVLKSDEARVLKSYPAGLGFSYPEEYFRHGAFDKATDLMIDGNIYVLSNGSEKVYKFYGGVQDQFALSGLDKDLGNVRCGFSNISDSKPLYIYDKGNERIVVIEKGTGEKHPGQGVMISQYIYRGSRDDILTDVKEIVVDSEEKYMYLLDGTKILRISL